MGFIYAHINRSNGHIYFGQTTMSSVEERWNNGLGYQEQTFGNYLFTEAVTNGKNGTPKELIPYAFSNLFDHVSFKVNDGYLDFWERFLIRLFHTSDLGKYGYNEKVGGVDYQDVELKVASIPPTMKKWIIENLPEDRPFDKKQEQIIETIKLRVNEEQYLKDLRDSYSRKESELEANYLSKERVLEEKCSNKEKELRDSYYMKKRELEGEYLSKEKVLEANYLKKEGELVEKCSNKEKELDTRYCERVREFKEYVEEKCSTNEKELEANYLSKKAELEKELEERYSNKEKELEERYSNKERELDTCYSKKMAEFKDLKEKCLNRAKELEKELEERYSNKEKELEEMELKKTEKRRAKKETRELVVFAIITIVLLVFAVVGSRNECPGCHQPLWIIDDTWTNELTMYNFPQEGGYDVICKKCGTVLKHVSVAP